MSDVKFSIIKETKVNAKKVKSHHKKVEFFDNLEFLIMCSPAVLYFVVFSYLPLLGLIIAFKDYKPAFGMLGSKWVGLQNFEYFLRSQDAWRITRNTLAYNMVFIFLGLAAAVFVALMLYEVKSKFAIKFYQTSMILPKFLSWVIVGYITYIVLDPSYGILNQALALFHIEPIQWYSNPAYWPFILPITQIWKMVGLNCVIYYAALMGVDAEIYEAARIDGASRWKQAWYISVPSLIPIMTILTIMAMGNIFRGDFGLFYQISRDIGTLYPTTDVIDTYIYRGIRTGNMSVTTAVGLFQSVIGFGTVLITNYIVNKINPENAMF